MPINALPESTTRAISSILALNDACAVVKELVDNALDAHASIITVEISPNTLDTIQVRDNGHGIDNDDRKHICKRSHTSKIESLEDLRCLGGTSLGFRGEALWSIAELSRLVTVTTRTDGEVAGETLKYDCSGALASPSKTSHPVGSSVKVCDFLCKIPVRRQTALKSPTKTLNNIKKLLQNYAFARPRVRLSLRVLKGKDPKFNWTYAPKNNATLSEAAVQVLGQDVYAQCVSKSITSIDGLKDSIEKLDNSSQATEATSAEGHITFDILLPRINGDLSKIANGGQYISIDHRPLSCARGIPKEIVKLFKSYMRAGSRKFDFNYTVSNPFFCLHIQSPRGSYDVNVEPAKDDVLFGDSAIMLDLVEKVLKEAYGELEKGSSLSERPKNQNVYSEDFNLLLSRKPIGSHESGQRNKSSRQQEDEFAFSALGQQLPTLHNSSETRSDQKVFSSQAATSPSPKSGSMQNPKGPTWSARNMYETAQDEDEEENEMTTSPTKVDKQSQIPNEDPDEAELRNVRVTNPWSLAKLHGKVQPRQCSDAINNLENAEGLDSSPDTNMQSSMPMAQSPNLPTPAVSSPPLPLRQNPGPPRRPWTRNLTPEQETSAEKSLEKDRGGSGMSSQQPRQMFLGDQYSTVTLTSNPRSEQFDMREGRFSPPKSARDRKKPQRLELNSDFDPDTDSHQLPKSNTVTVLSHHDHSRPIPSQSINRPFISPSKSQSSPLAALPARSHPNQFAASPVSIYSPKKASPPSTSYLYTGSPSKIIKPALVSSQTSQPTLASLMDYEHRKKAVIASQRESFRREAPPKIDLRASDKHSEDPIAESAAIAKRFTSSPYQNRYHAAKANLYSAESLQTFKLPDSDPRAYFLRYSDKSNNAGTSNNSTSSKLKVKRLKTALLPLESVPLGSRLHMIDALLPTDVCSSSSIKGQALAFRGTDRYVSTGQPGFASEQWSTTQLDPEVLARWEKGIRNVLDQKMRALREMDLSIVDDTDGIGNGDLEMDLADAIRKVAVVES